MQSNNRANTRANTHPAGQNMSEQINHDHYYEYPRWAKTSLGTTIPCYSSLPINQFKGKKPVILLGGVHGDEPEGVALAQATLQWLIANPNAVKTDWLVIPCINPDGLAKNERTNANGVDLNRNFPAKGWTTEAKKPRYYPGPHRGSELETQAVVSLIEQTEPSLVIHCHAWEPCVVYTGETGRAAAEKLAEASGYQARPTIGYDTPGSLGDYGNHDLGIPVICIEANSGDPLDSIWPRFMTGMQWVFHNRHPSE